MSVKIIDSIMGSGKTTWAINKMNTASSSQKFVYITPFLDEVQRIKREVNSRTMVEPNSRNGEGTKLRSFKELIASGFDVVSTHALFKSADDELIRAIEEGNYTLILDEVMGVIDRVDIGKSDINALTTSGLIRVDENNQRVHWIDSGYDSGRFNDIKLLADSDNLYKFKNLFVWTFPPQVFSAFKGTYVMTYLFDAQIQRCYFDLFGIDYQKFMILDNRLVNYNRSLENREAVFKLINIYDGPLNSIGEERFALSTNRLKTYSPKVISRIKNNLNNYLRNIMGAKAGDILWTTLKDKQRALSGAGFSRSYVEWNIRATNDYADRSVLAFIYNRFINPYEKVFFETPPRNITVDDDLLAVSDLLQWIWRSRIRNGQPIDLFLPSARMRNLLLSWANYEI
ncbi:hypothetical protein [Bacillus pumilus]|uniref:hypothetical protein n=1 Tax=Bacillus pumilus TaxID=1408 RepID=UPI00227F0667|nr:hypothetical protein [Bacillus pumilus]MCY7572457.1 hypothetical protein [Bacillus pumilus]MEC3761523.1 hypothetical protein [Bacillus pumilus]